MNLHVHSRKSQGRCERSNAADIEEESRQPGSGCTNVCKRDADGE